MFADTCVQPLRERADGEMRNAAGLQQRLVCRAGLRDVQVLPQRTGKNIRPLLRHGELASPDEFLHMTQ